MALCKKDSSFPPPHAWAPVPAHSVPRAIRRKLLSLKTYYQTQLSTLGLLSLEALHLPQTWVVLGWGWVGGRLGFDRQLGSLGCRPGLPPLPAPSQLAPEGKRGWGQLHRETFVLAQNRHRLGT